MKRCILFILVILFLGELASAQIKVANFSVGKYGSENYEHFSFGEKHGKKANILYSYGSDGKEVKLKYLGTDQVKGESSFKVQFPNNNILYITPKDSTLQVTNESGNYLKNFSWEYEGPVNGIGTFCKECAEDGTAAMQIIRNAYLK